MTPAEIREWSSRYRNGDRSRRACDAHAHYNRAARAARRADRRARAAQWRPSLTRLLTISKTVEGVADNRADDDALDKIEQLCRARAMLSKEIDAHVARAIAAGYPPFTVGVFMDRPPL